MATKRCATIPTLRIHAIFVGVGAAGALPFPASKPNRPKSGPRKECVMAPISSSTAVAHPGVTEGRHLSSWWGDRGVSTKILTAVVIGLVLAVAVGVLGLSRL